MKKQKKIKPQKPLVIIKRVIDEVKDTFNLYEYFGIDDEPISEEEKIKFVYETWEAIEFRHDFIKALFGEHYPTGKLEEWKFCDKCKKMIVYKDGGEDSDKININDFIYCPKCATKTSYHVQKVMYHDIYIHRLRDGVTIENKDKRLQYIWQCLELKEENKKVDNRLDKKVKELVAKNK